MATLNNFVTWDGDVITLPNKPVDRYSSNQIARITPKASRPFALEAYSIWQAGLPGVPWDGVYTDDDGPQNLTYNDE
jgi:hypothetical protein